MELVLRPLRSSSTFELHILWNISDDILVRYTQWRIKVAKTCTPGKTLMASREKVQALAGGCGASTDLLSFYGGKRISGCEHTYGAAGVRLGLMATVVVKCVRRTSWSENNANHNEKGTNAGCSACVAI